MFIPLSILSVYLLLVHDVTSADVNHVKRVPRRHTHVTRTYDYNHPPIPNDEIPVIVVYDNQEDRPENVRKAVRTTADEKKELKHAGSSGKSINVEALNVNHPPSRGLLYPYDGVNDFEDFLSLRPRARSINTPVAKTDKTITPVESETRTGNTLRKRIQKVRKIKVDKSQLDVFVTEITGNKETQKEATTTSPQTIGKEPPQRAPQTFSRRRGMRDPVVDKSQNDAFIAEITGKKEATTTSPQTVGKEPSQHVPQTFSRRKGMRDPVVPIIESESFVFSHSGNFHYSYEGGDGTKAYERGQLKSVNGGSGSAVEGNFSYKDEDGNDVSLSYTADENGYRPVGAHLPTPPPIPIAIQRALAYLATKTPEPITERTKKL